MTSPGPATVFLMGGVGSLASAVRPMFRWAYCEPGTTNTVVEVNYPNLLPPYMPGIEEGAETLNGLLTSTAGRKIVKVHSLGCLVAGYWLTIYGPTSGIPAADLSFLMGGNSVRRFNGYYPLNDFALLGIPDFVSADTMTPADTPYTVRDVAVRGDGWADWPNDDTNQEAVTWATWGQLQFHIEPYFSASLDRADYVEFTPEISAGVPGNITYVTIPNGLDGSEKQARIEAAYDRPAPFIQYWVESTNPLVPDSIANPVSSWNYFESRRKVIDEEARAPSLYRLWDKSMHYIGTVHTHKSFDAEQIQHDTGTGEVVLRGSDWLVKFLRTDVRAEEDLNFTVDPYPHRRNWRTRWGFKVTDVKVGKSEDGELTVTLQISENREHWKHILFGATIFAPPEAQPLKAWLLPGNCRTIIALTGAANLARLFYPPLTVLTNLLNPGAYVGAALGTPFNFSFRNHPIQMQFVNPVFDQSRLSVIMSRWQDAHSVTETMLRDAGCQVRVYTWLEEDEDSPHPELAALVGEQLARPTRNCYVIAVENKSGITGITGTAIDGATNLLAATGDDLITTTLFAEYDENGDGVTDPLIRKWFGAAPEVPSLVFRAGDRSAIITSEHHMYKSKAKTIMTGGKSPQWLNQVQTFLIRYAISKIAEAITSIPGAPAQLPGSEGIENVYQNQADDVFFAFIRYTDPNRELRSADYGFLEDFVQGSGSAYVISSPLTIREGLDKTKPFHAFKTEVRNARPHRIFVDFDLGDRALFENDGILHQDHISALGLKEDETTPKTFRISIGDDREADTGLARVTRTAQEFWNGLAMIFGQATNF